MLLASPYSLPASMLQEAEKEMLFLVLVVDNHRRPLRCSNIGNSKGKPDLDGEIRQRAPQLADAGCGKEFCENRELVH